MTDLNISTELTFQILGKLLLENAALTVRVQELEQVITQLAGENGVHRSVPVAE